MEKEKAAPRAARLDELGIEPKTLSNMVYRLPPRRKDEVANDTLYQLSYTPDDILYLRRHSFECSTSRKASRRAHSLT